MDRFLLARLSQAERESFERHLFECPECAEEMEALETIQAALRKVPVEADARVQWRSRWFVAAVAAAACVAAVAFGLWLVAPRPQTVARGLPAPEPPPSPAPAVPEKAPSVSPDLFALAEIRPPAYNPTVLRGGTDDADNDFRKAMEAYRRSDYAAAIPGLRAAAQRAPGDPRPAFYLGACQLLIGDIDRGVSTLEGRRGTRRHPLPRGDAPPAGQGAPLARGAGAGQGRASFRARVEWGPREGDPAPAPGSRRVTGLR